MPKWIFKKTSGDQHGVRVLVYQVDPNLLFWISDTVWTFEDNLRSGCAPHCTVNQGPLAPQFCWPPCSVGSWLTDWKYCYCLVSMWIYTSFWVSIRGGGEWYFSNNLGEGGIDPLWPPVPPALHWLTGTTATVWCQCGFIRSSLLSFDIRADTSSANVCVLDIDPIQLLKIVV